MRFSLGRIVATPGALELLGTGEIGELLGRHAAGDWGVVGPEDARENELSVREGFRILSDYDSPGGGGRIWIITEADRSSTCSSSPRNTNPRPVQSDQIGPGILPIVPAGASILPK